MSVQKLSSHFEYLENLICCLDLTLQPSELTFMRMRAQSCSHGATKSGVRLCTMMPSLQNDRAGRSANLHQHLLQTWTFICINYWTD